MENSQELEIDILQLLRAMMKKWWVIALVSLLCAALTLGYTALFVTPEYEASILMYVNNSSISIGGASVSISSGELTAAKTLVSTYLVILNTRTTLEEVLKTTGLDYTYEQLKKMISSSAVNNTEIFEVKVTSTDPVEAYQIANTIAEILPDKISGIVEGSSVRTVDLAVVPGVRSAPSYSKNTVIGLLVGFVLSAGAICVYEIFNDTITSEEWILTTFRERYPLLASVPDINAKNGKHYGRYYGEYVHNSEEEDDDDD